MRTVRRLRLRCFSFNIYSDVLSTLLLVALSKPWQAHQNKSFLACSWSSSKLFQSYVHNAYIQYTCKKMISNARIPSAIKFLLVDLAGVEPASRTLFSLLRTAINYLPWPLYFLKPFLLVLFIVLVLGLLPPWQVRLLTT